MCETLKVKTTKDSVPEGSTDCQIYWEAGWRTREYSRFANVRKHLDGKPQNTALQVAILEEVGQYILNCT